MGRFIIKHSQDIGPKDYVFSVINPVENNIKEEKSVMTTEEKIALAQSVIGEAPIAKRVKKDKGLIERTESSKIVLTEDNKELLND